MPLTNLQPTSAFASYQKKTAEDRAHFLRSIAEKVESLGDELVNCVMAETHLPEGRVKGERLRTCNQLRMFADCISEGSWVDAVIDAPSDTTKPDLRRCRQAVGPVAVFGASNFPLAFGTAGGDTASALAAGCTVTYKGHPAHPKTTKMLSEAISEVARITRMPEGVFTLVEGGVEEGIKLVNDPTIQSVAFTGSLRAGRALFDIASKRPVPIPVFAEMGSTNPIYVTSGAMSDRGREIAKGYAESLVLGVGQFCTNPGVLVVVDSEELEGFLVNVASHLASVAPAKMLYAGIRESYLASLKVWESNPKLTTLFAGDMTSEGVLPALVKCSASEAIADNSILEEVFGPAGVVVVCKDVDEVVELFESMPGQLTASIHFDSAEQSNVQEVIHHFARFAGRVIANGYPTGVEVCAAMHHGGPYPATTDSRFTSVGLGAIARFARPVCFQNMPDGLLPDDLKNSNPRGILRQLNGQFTRDSITS